MENIIEKQSYEVVSSQFNIYGEYVNLHRHVPYVFDGLKPSYRRTIQSAIDVAQDKMAKVATISGHCIGHLHPHGDASINPIVSQLVNSGIFIGQGNHGCEVLHGEDMEPAAPRYIEAMLSPAYKNLLLPLLPFVPTFINDLGNKEYEYLPVPIPLGLTFGYLGIAVATGCRIPAFTPKSILNAYLHDDPTLLESTYGLIIENQDGLRDLWKSSRGRLNYSLHYKVQNQTVKITGSKGPLKLDWTWLDSQANQSRIEINDLSSNIPSVEIAKAARFHYPSIEEITNQVVKMIRGSESYYLRVVANNQVRDIGIKDWIDITYNNYCKIYRKYMDNMIKNLEYDIQIFSNFRTVADKIINTKQSYEEIANSLNIKLDIVKSIGSKSINALRTSDPRSKVSELQSKIKSIKSTDINKVIETNISNL